HVDLRWRAWIHSSTRPVIEKNKTAAATTSMKIFHVIPVLRPLWRSLKYASQPRSVASNFAAPLARSMETHESRPGPGAEMYNSSSDHSAVASCSDNLNASSAQAAI